MSQEGKKIKVLIAKTSLDGHWRGVAMVTTALRDAGMEVIYAGMLTPQQIAEAALQEDVDVIGLNIGGRYGTVRDLMQILREKGVTDKLIIAGGTIPREDIPLLKEMGVHEVFPPGSPLDAIVEYVRKEAGRKA